MPELSLIGDVGGTNARFALVDANGDGYSDEATFACTDFAGPEAAIEAYLHQTGRKAIGAVCLAAAGPLIEDGISITNSPWQLSASTLSSHFGVENVQLLNDFEAVAYSLPEAAREHAIAIGPVPHRPLDQETFHVCVLGAGTGLGVAGLARTGGSEVALVTEGGHIGFAPETEQQAAILARLRATYGRVSAERLASGMGIENIHTALAQLAGDDSEPLASADIFERARIAPGRARDAVSLFYEILGQIAGDLVLAQGAYDGAYVCGGVVQRQADLLAASRFRNGFENKGRHRHLMERVPTALITHSEPGLLGVARIARGLLV